MTENRIFIHQKIKAFIRKYYLNKLYKGVLVFVMITLGAFIAFTLLEYFSYLNSATRATLFYIYLALFLGTIGVYVVYPLAKIAGLGKIINSATVSKIIGKHFPEIDDKLLNVIQLESQMERGEYKSMDLLNAAIDTKIETLKPFAFVKAIPFKKTTKFVKWAMIPVLLFCVLFTTKSEIFTTSTQRIVQYQQYFEKPAPYKIEVENQSLKALQNEDFTVNIKVVGDEIPQELFIVFDKRNYRCVKQSNTEFSYTFSNLQREVTFQLQTQEVTTQSYTINVLPKPVIVSYVMDLNYPAYLNKNSETVENNGDATVPEGTRITWKFYTKNTNQIDFLLYDKEEILTPEKEVFTYSHTAHESFNYATITKNQHFVSPDTLSYNVQVIKDLHPEIAVQSQTDSLFADRVYFKGNIKDDYGFSSLQFVYAVYNEQNSLLAQNKTIDIHFDRNTTIQDFYFNFDAGSLDLRPGYSMEYFFEVKDNDGVNGAKSAKTHAVTFRLKTMDEINKEMAQGNEQAKSSMDDLAKEAAELAKELEKMGQQLLQVNEPSWQDKKKMEDLMEKYQELQEKILDAKENQEQNLVKEEQYKNTASEILKKQEELQKRFDNFSDEMKQMIEKLQNMMQEMNKDQMREAVEKMKMSAEDINKSLDQQLELYKLLEFEKKFEEVIQNTRNLAQEQRELSQQTEQKTTPKDDLMQKQEQLNQKFEDLKKEIKDLHQLNKELEEPNKMEDRAEQEKQIEEKMKEALEQISKNNRSKASDSQDDAAQQMDDMADALQFEKEDAEEEDLAEDIETLRQILENLIRTSFKQEEVMQNIRRARDKSPLLTDFIREQSNIQDYMRMIDDSLTQLAKRQPMVEPFITKEVTKIREYSKGAQDQLVERMLPQGMSNQQFALTSMNNLTLMLAESLKKMKDMQSNANCCKGKASKCGKCSKPGGNGKGKPKSARQLQEQLNRQMEAMKRSMEQGSKPGETPVPGQQGMSEQFARMAAQQEAIRKMMQDYNDELKGSDGMGDKAIEQLLEEMKKTEKELVNRSISAQTIARQKNIETRMLESERAHQEREKEEKRESIEARERYNPSPPKEWQFDKNRSQQTELLKTVPPALQYYYKEKVNRYFYNIGE